MVARLACLYQTECASLAVISTVLACAPLSVREEGGQCFFSPPEAIIGSLVLIVIIM